MGWWSDFDRTEVAADFARIAASGLDSIRLFLTWADFQPAPDEVDRRMLDRLIAVADLAAGAGVALVPTLFTGHMSGVNWIPAWALGGTDRDNRFRVVSDGRVSGSGLRNWYADPLIARAQPLLATEAAGALAGHDAVWLWDLGNESSNSDPPLDLAGHERSFGLWRADGSPKPSVAVVEAFAGARRLAGPDEYPWIDLEPEEFLVDPNVELPRLHARYRMSEQGDPAR
jgi:endo-1,4-beta-mannosidase